MLPCSDPEHPTPGTAGVTGVHLGTTPGLGHPGGVQPGGFCGCWEGPGWGIFVHCCAALLRVPAFHLRNFTFGECGSALEALCVF